MTLHAPSGDPSSKFDLIPEFWFQLSGIRIWYSRSATVRESNKRSACKILNHAKFDHSERLPEGDLCIALLLGFSGSPTRLTTLLKAVFFSRKIGPGFSVPEGNKGNYTPTVTESWNQNFRFQILAPKIWLQNSGTRI